MCEINFKLEPPLLNLFPICKATASYTADDCSTLPCGFDYLQDNKQMNAIDK